MDTHIPFHQWIEAKRKERKLTRPEAVARMNAVYRDDPYGETAWKNWETRPARPSYVRCDRVAAGLGVPKEEVYLAAGLLSPTERKKTLSIALYNALTEDQQATIDAVMQQYAAANRRQRK